MNPQRFFIILAIMSATIMQTLDSTIVNVALPHMAAELNAQIDSITWVVTSYVVGSSVFMPLTGFMTDRLGRRRFLLICIGGFVITSGLCGIANGLAEMVAFRLMQGVFGAALIPLSQATLLEVTPQEDRGKAMALWGMGVMAAPIFGPTLGGYLTENYSWRWNFYINLPIGIVSLLLAARYVPTTKTVERQLEWRGLLLLSAAILSMQVVLDRGNQDDWFDSTLITSLMVLSVVSLAGFLILSRIARGPLLFDLRVFKDRNFTLATAIIAIMGLAIFGGQLLQPQFMETMLGFSSIAAGIFLMPRGIGTLLGMMIVGRLTNTVPIRILLLTGMSIAVLGSYMMTGYTIETSGQTMMIPLFLQGLGMGVVFVPVTVLAYTTLPPALSVEAAGLFALMRSIGQSFGISLITTYLTRQTMSSWSSLRGYIDPYRLEYQQHAAMVEKLVPKTAVIPTIAQEIWRQAQMAAFVNSFWVILASMAILIPPIFLLRTPPKTAPKIEAPMDLH